jgi:hypothetical protein
VPLLQSPGDLVHHAQVRLHLRNDVGTLHFHDDFFTRVQDRAMHLRHGGRRQRLFLKFLEGLFRRHLQFARDDFHDLRVRKRTRGALQLGQFFRVFLG